jgi:hypothetical protein
MMWSIQQTLVKVVLLERLLMLNKCKNRQRQIQRQRQRQIQRQRQRQIQRQVIIDRFWINE